MVLGVSGGIAAYKAVELCRRLVDAGAHVVPVLTHDARRFVGDVTFSALASEPVRTSLWTGGGDSRAAADPVPHVELGRSADVVLVVPATANLLARYAAGMADDLLLATLLVTRAPVVLCPAMHTEMWGHPSVVDNVAVLRSRGVHILDPDTGPLAGGDEGAGRLPGTEDILAFVERAVAPETQDLAGRRVLVTAGGTREPLDPVRFLGNRSSGKQGYAVAAEAAARGATVTLVATVERPVPPGVRRMLVETAAEMEEAVLAAGEGADVVVMAAAVADFRPKAVAAEKIAKSDVGGVADVVLEPTPDILAELGRRKRPGQLLVGFAAETDDVHHRAAAKLQTKNLDFIVANDVRAPGAGFEHDTNLVVVIDKRGMARDLPLMDKREVAKTVLDMVVSTLAGERQ